MAYTFQTITFGSDSFTELFGINDAEIVSGSHGAGTSSGFTFAIPATAGQPIPFATEVYPGAQSTQVTGIDAKGDTVGSYIDVNGVAHGFADIGGTFTTIDQSSSSSIQLYGVNTSGGYAGINNSNLLGSIIPLYVADFGGGHSAFLWLPTNVSNASPGIDEADDFVGYYTATSGHTFGFYASAGSVTTLQYPASSLTEALAINQTGQIAGCFADSIGMRHGFVYDVKTKAFTQIDIKGATDTTVTGINDFGQIVGYSTVGGATTGFIGTPSGPMTILAPISTFRYVVPAGTTAVMFGGTTAATVDNSAAPGAVVTGNGASGIYSQSVAGTINAAAGNNTLTSTSSSASMLAGDGNNIVVVGKLTTGDSVRVGGGDNQIFLFGDGVSVNAGSGSNVLLAQTNGSTIALGSGNAFVFGSNNIVNLTTPAQVVSVNGSGNTVTLGDVAAGSSAPLVFGQGATYSLGTGNYQIFDTGSGGRISSTAGNVTFVGTSGSETITLGAGNALIGVGGTGNNVTVGAGDSTIFAVGGSSAIQMGAGNETVVIGGGGNTVVLGAGQSALFLDGTGRNVVTLASGNHLDAYGFDASATGGDALELGTLLAGTNATSDLANVASFISASASGSDTLLTATINGSSSVVADLHGVGQQSLAQLVSEHALRM